MRLFDLHCDTLYECVQKKKKLRSGDMHISLEKGSGYAPWIQCFGVWIPDEFRGDQAFALFEACREVFDREAEQNAYFYPVKTKTDLIAAADGNKCGAILTVESGAAARGSCAGIQRLFDCGVRLMTLTWNGSNEFGDGVGVAHAGGLTDFGREAVHYMNQIGMTVDVSHLSDQGFYDVAEISDKPFVATHSNARRITQVPRNLTDEQFCEIRDRGGIVGINFYKGFLKDNEEAEEIDFLRHVEHFLALDGQKTVCLGSDFDGADMPGFIRDITDVAKLYKLLLRHGYSQQLIDDIFYGNAFVFFEKNLPGI